MRHSYSSSLFVYEPSAVSQSADEPEEKWSRRQSLLFIAAASAGCWGVIIFTAYLII